MMAFRSRFPRFASRSKVTYKDTTYTKIFIGRLPDHTTDTSLRAFFEKFGEVEEAVVITHFKTGKSKGYGFVTMVNETAAWYACRDRNPFIDGNQVNVHLAYEGKKPTDQPVQFYPHGTRSLFALNTRIPRFVQSRYRMPQTQHIGYYGGAVGASRPGMPSMVPRGYYGGAVGAFRPGMPPMAPQYPLSPTSHCAGASMPMMDWPIRTYTNELPTTTVPQVGVPMYPEVMEMSPALGQVPYVQPQHSTTTGMLINPTPASYASQLPPAGFANEMPATTIPEAGYPEMMETSYVTPSAAPANAPYVEPQPSAPESIATYEPDQIVAPECSSEALCE